MTGTTSLLGRSIPIWGFSSTGAAGSATAPGPLLVVDEGDTVSITLHNTLTEPVSLALPGQPASAFTTGLSAQAEEAGAAPGGTRTYTFSAGRPGTFVYEAGHTAGGARQVAMGLAGALVVRAADGSAYGARSGYPTTAYDDDAVVVLSEIDPALNAAPATFDMRSFHPAYRLINGKPYPSTDPVSTDQGHRVLLRYVNVGSQTHSMSLLGGDQTQVADDGHPLRYAESAVTLAVEPGRDGRHPHDHAHRPRGEDRAVRGRRPPGQQRAVRPPTRCRSPSAACSPSSTRRHRHRALTAWDRCRRT